MNILPPDDSSIERAANALANGLLVAFPTETVYGLGADALDANALRKLYAAKGRPSDHPVIVHLASIDDLVKWTSAIPSAAFALAEQLWPGPMTLILPKSAQVPELVTGGQQSVGIRIPAHPVALKLLKRFGGGVAAPSANKFGKLSPTAASDVVAGFPANEVAFVIDGGNCEVGIESTIIDFSQPDENPRILRPGMILPEHVQSIIKPFGCELISGNSENSPLSHKTTTRAPGLLLSHYAPTTPVRIVDDVRLLHTIEELTLAGQSVCVLSFSVKSSVAEGVRSWILASSEPEAFARDLYSNLRELDRCKSSVILVERVKSSDEWSGIADRLARAAYPVSDHIRSKPEKPL